MFIKVISKFLLKILVNLKSYLIYIYRKCKYLFHDNSVHRINMDLDLTGFEAFEKYCTKHHCIVSPSFRAYVEHRTYSRSNISRIVYAWILNLVFFVNFCRYLSVYYFHNQWIYEFYGEPLAILSRPDIIALMSAIMFLFYFCMCKFICKITRLEFAN